MELAKNDLSKLANKINTEHRLCLEKMSESLQHALKVGELLIEAKELVEHGAWLPWIAENCEFAERTAQAYMRVARRWPELEKAQRVADLSFREVLHLLEEPKTRPEINEVIEIHEYGQVMPFMNEAEFNSLVESIKAQGLIKPITLYEGKILDGKCRYEACRLASVDPEFNIFPDDFPHYQGAALDFVLSANIHRQHYTEDQRAVMALQLSENHSLPEEEVIDKGLKSFVGVGLALAEIRDRDLYQEEYSSFGAYCGDQWGLSLRRANEYIDAAKIMSSLSGKAAIGAIQVLEKNGCKLTPVGLEFTRDITFDEWKEAGEALYLLDRIHGDRIVD